MTAELSSINPNTSLRGVVVSLPNQKPHILDVGFKYESGVHTPTVLIGFASSDYDSRDAFVRRFRALQTKPKGNAEELALKYGEDKENKGHQRAVDQRSRHPAYDSLGFEEPDFQPLSDELERLDVAAYSLEEILEATTGVLMVLSLLAPEIEAMGCGAARAVEKFTNAVKEASNG